MIKSVCGRGVGLRFAHYGWTSGDPGKRKAESRGVPPAHTHTVLSAVPSQKHRSPHPIAVQPHSNITRTPTPTHSHICTPAHTHTHTASSAPANTVLPPHRGRKAEHGESILVSCTEPHFAESHMAVTEDSVRTRSGSLMLTHVCCSFGWAHGWFWGQGLPPLCSAGGHPGEDTAALPQPVLPSAAGPRGSIHGRPPPIPSCGEQKCVPGGHPVGAHGVA